MTKRRKKKYKLKKFNCLIILLIIFSIVYLNSSIKNISYKKTVDKINPIKWINPKDDSGKKESEYNECLSKTFTQEEITNDIKGKVNEINYIINNRLYKNNDIDLLNINNNEDSSEVKNHDISIVYEDITTGFSYSYNPDEVYYGASLIKLVEALYLIDNDIDFNTTIKYERKYVAAYSDGMSKRKVGENVTINDLISYAIMYSDNSAHFMLSDYIGVNKLKEYGRNLGAKNILTSGDTFGNQSANDTNIYLHHAKKLFDSGNEKALRLKEWMKNTYYNSLYLTNDENNNVCHKYGWYESNYHDIGIVYADRPYYISILTRHGKGDYKLIVNNLHKKINELHNMYYSNRQKKCHQQVYGK